ncbi:MIT domain-containing protein 1 [Culex quinquefasciatus]|uniref:MIT domain-containing protein 1 n=1 Tax=Culex quinquefasciatus TaxID=7176 RepID=B0X0P8_CULQU|nr:MIT domain-containing protein 1 [Culex quinquefasciatus]|eukprot:XP_001863220.1 MIT domain-containing protein 1 [Culex quinquefasciatus]
MAQMAITLLTRAIEYDINGRKLESLKLYEDGIEALLKESKAEVDPKRKQHFQSKILEYMARAEQVKEQITRWRSRGEIRDKIHVVEGATGYSYGRVFGKYMTDEVKEIMIEEPYVREHHQLCNVVMFCELAVSSCKALKFVKLMTVREKKNNDEQARALQILKDSVKKQGVEFFVEYSEHMHDRQVISGVTVRSLESWFKRYVMTLKCGSLMIANQARANHDPNACRGSHEPLLSHRE